jgi:hypothetical protein
MNWFKPKRVINIVHRSGKNATITITGDNNEIVNDLAQVILDKMRKSSDKDECDLPPDIKKTFDEINGKLNQLFPISGYDYQ